MGDSLPRADASFNAFSYLRYFLARLRTPHPFRYNPDEGGQDHGT
jgi:hypothetical protein